jgi:hypothetical protein
MSYELDQSSSGEGSVVGFKHINKSSNSLKVGKGLDQLND